MENPLFGVFFESLSSSPMLNSSSIAINRALFDSQTLLQFPFSEHVLNVLALLLQSHSRHKILKLEYFLKAQVLFKGKAFSKSPFQSIFQSGSRFAKLQAVLKSAPQPLLTPNPSQIYSLLQNPKAFFKYLYRTFVTTKAISKYA